MAKKINPKGVNTSGDITKESAFIDQLGSAKPGSVSRIAVTGSYQNAPTSGDAILDMEDVDTVFAIIDLTISAATDHRVKVLYGVEDADAKVNVQETREDNTIANQIRHEVVEHVFTATGIYIIEITRLYRFMKLQFKGSGSPDASDEMAISLVGQRREAS